MRKYLVASVVSRVLLEGGLLLGFLLCSSWLVGRCGR